VKHMIYTIKHWTGEQLRFSSKAYFKRFVTYIIHSQFRLADSFYTSLWKLDNEGVSIEGKELVIRMILVCVCVCVCVCVTISLNIIDTRG
jgi:hypothetical protein